MKYKILTVDDDLVFLESIKKVLQTEDYLVETLAVSTDFDDYIKNNDYDAILLDIKMPGLNGIDLLKNILAQSPSLPVIIISGQSTISIAVEAIKLGAYDFIEKPIDKNRLFAVLKNAVNKKSLSEEANRLLGTIAENYRMVGHSSELKKVCSDIDKIAKTNSKILITGESGVGKELIAWEVFYRSERREKPFIKLNCAAIPKELLESELFGYVRGAFTGAHQNKIGKFEAADGGTLFLDEIGEMDIAVQAKLLRVLEDGEIDVIGDPTPRKIDVRIISATNQNLNQKVEQGTFRRDLFHRLNVLRINIPPLKDRKDDIIPIAYHFLEKFNNEYNKQLTTIDTQASGVLISHNWPGNVRELRSVIENIVVFSSHSKVIIDDVIEAFNRLEGSASKNSKQKQLSKDLKTAKEEYEKEYILDALTMNEWKIGETAEMLGIDRTNLFKKMQKYEIKR